MEGEYMSEGRTESRHARHFAWFCDSCAAKSDTGCYFPREKIEWHIPWRDQSKDASW